jgi:hypothetical protein
VAEQGQTKDTDHQEPVFHSVIPNPLAMDYNNRMIYPSGSWSDVIVDQRFSYIAVENPFETSRELSYFMVKRVLVKYSNDFTSHPEKGSCCLYDENYFKSCFLMFDKQWEDNDIANDVDVCIITGQPGPFDKGRNKILLSGRIYKKGYEIPTLFNKNEDQRIQNQFYSKRRF